MSMINNEELSRLALNFKALSEHPAELLALKKNGFLRTITSEQKAPDTDTISCIKTVYKEVNDLLNIPPQQFTDSDIDFQLYATLIHRIVEWSRLPNPPGIACTEKDTLLATLTHFNAFFQHIEHTEEEETKKTVEASSCDELFAFNEGEEPEQPDILLIITDEEKVFSGYEGKAVRDFYEKLPGEKALRENGITIEGHGTASIACSPSRAIIATGQFPSLTNITQTDGMGKPYNHPEIRELPAEIPTSGSYFKEAKYKTKYIGKVHFSHDDLVGEGPNKLPETKISKPVNRPPNRVVEQEYLTANPLARYGYDGWVGPEPHGSSPHNTAYNRDSDYVRQLEECIDQRVATGDKSPHFTVISLVNPHDIVLFPLYWIYLAYKHGFKLLSEEAYALPIQLPPSMSDSLDDRPKVQQEYREQFSIMFTENSINGGYNGLGKERNPFNILYQRTYLYFKQLADKDILRIHQKIKDSPFYKKTIIIKTSDHGDFLGSHGGKLQKWFGTDGEAIHVPLVISNPGFKNKGKKYQEINGHDALLPTMLKLAKLDKDQLLGALQKTHPEAHPLVGKPIGDKPIPTGLDDATTRIGHRMLFVTSDRPFNGSNDRSILQQWFNLPRFLTRKIKGMHGNTFIESVEANLTIDGKKGRYRYATYKPDPTEPKKEHSDQHPQLEEEFYDLTNDRYGRLNLSNNKVLSARDETALAKMKDLLAWEQKNKLITPKNPNILTRPQKPVIQTVESRPDMDLLFYLLAPPTLLVLLLGYFAYKQRKNIVKAAPAVTLALSALGLYRHYQSSKSEYRVIEPVNRTDKEGNESAPLFI